MIFGKSFCFSGFLHELILNIEYKVVRWHIFCVCFFGFIICIHFFIRKKSTFYWTIDLKKIVRCTPLINILARNHKHIHNKTVNFYFFIIIKVILCASEHICSIVRYCSRSFKQLPLHVLTDANVLVLIDPDQSIFVNGRSRQTFTDQ